MGEVTRKTKLDTIVTIMLGIFCLLGSAVWITQLPFARVNTVHELSKQIASNTAATTEVQQQAVQAATVANKAEKVAKAVRTKDVTDCNDKIDDNTKNIAALRKSLTSFQQQISDLKKELRHDNSLE